jgi:hypothetical protein
MISSWKNFFVVHRSKHCPRLKANKYRHLRGGYYPRLLALEGINHHIPFRSTSRTLEGSHSGHTNAEVSPLFFNLILTHGFSIPPWHKATNVSIEKNPKINRLRIIHFLEADYSFILKLLWGSRLVHRVHELNLLMTANTFGSWSCSCIPLTKLFLNACASPPSIEL